MTPPLLVNENFPVPALRSLRALGFDVMAVGEIMPGASDPLVLERARESRRWLITFDRNYGELVFQRGLPSPPAIIFIKQEPVPPAAPAQWLADLLANPALVEGYFVVLGGSTTRRRSLPAAA